MNQLEPTVQALVNERNRLAAALERYERAESELPECAPSCLCPVAVCGDGQDIRCVSKSDYDALRAIAARALVDAKRYRWMRPWIGRMEELSARNFPEPTTPEEADATIDAAIQEGK